MAEEKEKTEQEKRNDELREIYAQEMEYYESTSNEILDGVRESGVSTHYPSPEKYHKQRPEQINDIHILISQQNPDVVKEGYDDSEEQEKKALSDTSNESTTSSSSSSDSNE